MKPERWQKLNELFHAALDQAFVALAEGYKQHEFQMQFLKLEPRWDNLRSDPRFADLTRRLKLPQ